MFGLDDLLRSRARAVEDAKRKKRNEKIKQTVVYTIDGKAAKRKKSFWSQDL